MEQRSTCLSSLDLEVAQLNVISIYVCFCVRKMDLCYHFYQQILFIILFYSCYLLPSFDQYRVFYFWNLQNPEIATPNF